MSFLKCIFCLEPSVNIICVFKNGNTKTQCKNCGITYAGGIKKEIKLPEIIYKK